MCEMNKYISNEKGLDAKKMAEQGGFSLFEMVLALGIFSLMLVGLVQYLQDIAINAQAHATATYYEKITIAVEDVFDDYVVFDQAYTDLQAMGGLAQFDLNAVNPTMAAIRDKLDANFSDTSPMKQPIRLIFRTVTGPPRSIDFLVASAIRVEDLKIRRAASFMGAQGGFVSIHAAGMTCVGSCERTVRSSYGGWALDSTQFPGTVLMTGPLANANNGGYLVQYRAFNELELAGDYLYRARIGNNVELNRMNAPLNMGGKVLGGVDNMELAGDVEVVRNVIVQGGASIDGNLSVTQDLVVNGDAAAQSIGVDNNLIVESKLQGASMAVNSMTAENTAIYDLVSPQVQGSNVIANTLDATGASQGIFAMGMQASGLDVEELMNAGVIESTTLNTGKLGIANASIDGNFNVSGEFDSNLMSVQTTRINALDDCEYGC